MTRVSKGELALAAALLSAALLSAGGLKIKKIKAKANPPSYVKFSQPLAKADQVNHALSRLTFGAAAGDRAQLERLGLKQWMERELHPEEVPESPVLAEKLAQLPSISMGIHDTYTHYPPKQLIVAYAKGRGQLPDDPELRELVVRLADRYLQKKNGTTETVANTATDANDDADLNLKMKLQDVLSPEQIEELQTGTPEQKRLVLAAIPSDRGMDFAWTMRRGEKQKLYNLAPVALRRDLMLTVNPEAVVASDLSEAKILRAVYSNHQLAELLDDFWLNHFNVFENKGQDRFMVSSYERETIRPYIFGSFYDLLVATAKSPAMLFFLDNWQSTKAVDPAHARPGKKSGRGLNENYGRELLELHTLGVDGGYTQKDVIEVARCFTGWTIAPPRKGSAFEYNDKVHDKGQKIVLGHVIAAGGGMNDGMQVLDILAHSPVTARFICTKLAQRFVADDPPPSLVNRMAQNFSKTGGDLRAVMQTMLLSPEFWSQGAYQAKVKTPLEMVASAARASNADITSAFALSNELQKLGEPLYRKVEPTGYSSANAEWVSSAALLERMNFALALTHNRIPGVKVDTEGWEAQAGRDPMALARSILEQNPSPQTQAAIEKTLASSQIQTQLMQTAHTGPPQTPSLVAGLTLGSPEFQRR